MSRAHNIKALLRWLGKPEVRTMAYKFVPPKTQECLLLVLHPSDSAVSWVGVGLESTYNFPNFVYFCRENDLNPGHFSEVAAGKRQSSKGYWAERVKLDQIKDGCYRGLVVPNHVLKAVFG